MTPRSLWTVNRASLLLAAALGCQFAPANAGIPVKTRVDGAIFPAEWLRPGIDAIAVPLDPAEAVRSARLAQEAMALYPVGLLDANLRAVYFVRQMSFYGVRYAGTNSNDSVYITNRGADCGFTDSYVKGTFHHEFSSILLRNYHEKFDARAWAAANREPNAYGTNGLEAIKNGRADTVYRARYNAEGFLNQYATASIEEDFNTIAEGLFSGDPDFWRVVDNFPRVAQKERLAVKFYSSLDSRFTEEFFRSLRS